MDPFIMKKVPQFSRAVDEDEDEVDWDEYDEASTECLLTLTPQVRKELLESSSKRLATSHLVVAFGQAACCFAEAFILGDDSELVGSLFNGFSDTMKNTFSQVAMSDTSCFIHRLCVNRDVLLCLCRTDVRPEQAHSWVEKLMSIITSESTQVISLMSQSVTGYRADVPCSALEIPMLRALSTTHFKGTLEAPLLEQPNLVEGLPAQILTYCQQRSIAGVLYLLYLESTCYVDTSAIKAFLPIMRSAPMSDIRTSPPANSEKVLASISSAFRETGILYT